MNDFPALGEVAVYYRGRAWVLNRPLSEFGGMLIRTMRNRIRRGEGKVICACWCIVSCCRCESVLYARMSYGLGCATAILQ